MLVRREGRVGFRHELLRAAVYAGLPDAAGLHDRVADGIDPAEHVERAHHLAAVGTGARVGPGAGGRRRPGARRSARSTRRPSCSRRPSRPIRPTGALWLELEEVYAWAHRQHEMEAAWAEVLLRLPAADLPEAWCRRGRQFRTVTCHPEESLRAYRTAELLATPSTDPAVLAEALIGVAWGDTVAGTGTEVERLLREAAALIDLGPQLRADAMEIQMQSLIRQARFAEAAAVVADPRDPTVRIMEAFPDRAYSVLVNAACALVYIGEDEAALALVDRALVATTRRHGVGPEDPVRPGPGARPARPSRGGRPRRPAGAGVGRPARRPPDGRDGDPRPGPARARGPVATPRPPTCCAARSTRVPTSAASRRD